MKEEGELDDDEAVELHIEPNVEKLLREIQALNRRSRWVMANRNGDVPQYSKIYKRLMRTGFFEEAGHCSHKIRKTTKTLGQIWCGSEDSMNLLRHSGPAVSDRYIDDRILAKHNPIPKILSEMTK